MSSGIKKLVGVGLVIAGLVLTVLVVNFFSDRDIAYKLLFSFAGHGVYWTDKANYYYMNSSAPAFWPWLIILYLWLALMVCYVLLARPKGRSGKWTATKAILFYGAIGTVALFLISGGYPRIDIYSFTSTSNRPLWDATVSRFETSMLGIPVLWFGLLLWHFYPTWKGIVSYLWQANASLQPATSLAYAGSSAAPTFPTTGQPLPVHASSPQTPLRKAKPVYPKDGSLLGQDIVTAEEVRISQGERRRGLYVIGKNGTGKTTCLVNLMLQDIEDGMGLCFLDPHGDAITDILRRLPKSREQDVILLDVLDTKYPFGLNLYECSDPRDLELAARSCEQVMHVFEKVWGVEGKNPSWGPAMEDLLRNIALTFIHKQDLTLSEIPLVLTDDTAREKITTNLKSTQLRLFWNQFSRRKDKNEYMASTLNKVRAFLSNPIVEHIVGQAHTTIDFRAIMDEGKILLVKLPGRYEDITSLLGAVIIGQLLNAALSRVDLPESKRRQFNLYADEYQRFATPDFATLLAESRKFAIASTIAHQFRDQLDQANRGATLNAANIVVFRVSGEDGEELAKEFDATPPPPEIIGQKPILTPKREVIDHLLKNGHSNPAHLRGTTVLIALYEAAGMHVDRPQFNQTDNLIAIGLQMRAGKKYADMMQLQQDLKVTLQRLNLFFYEVMRDRDANKPIDREDFIIILRVSEVYDRVKNNPEIISLLCSPDGAKQEQAFNRLRAWAGTNKKRQSQAEMVIKITTALRELMQVLAKDPIMVDSGQHEPILDKPRTYADVQNQIATDLANLRQYTAKCKLGHTEVVIQTLPLETGTPDEAFSLRCDRIQKRTRQDYCKERALVEEEISTRQEKLLEQEEKKRRTTEEETI